MAYLILVRHGQSEWNELGLWTGLRDISLTEKGREEARQGAQTLAHLTIHKAHTSDLKRTIETLDEIKAAIGLEDLETVAHPALNERDYGDYTAKNKWDIQKEIGEENFTKLRRSWDHPVPNGETLKDVHARALPYFEEHILKDLKAGKNILVSGHGNTLRALMKHLEAVTDDKVHEVEIGTGEIVMYEINQDGTVVDKQILMAGGKA